MNKRTREWLKDARAELKSIAPKIPKDGKHGTTIDAITSRVRTPPSISGAARAAVFAGWKVIGKVPSYYPHRKGRRISVYAPL